MKTTTLRSSTQQNRSETHLPVTARGRALYTTDWFLNGKPVLRYHDNPRMTLRNDMPC